MEVFQQCKIACVTHALPGKSGWHHVNCQNQDYWEKIFKDYNFYIDMEESYYIREISNMKFMKKTGCLFKNKKYFLFFILTIIFILL